MRRRIAVWLAWSLAGLSVAMFVTSIVLFILVQVAQFPSDWGTGGPLSGLLIFLPFLAFPLVGALIASRRPENPIGWNCLAAGLFWMFIVLAEASDDYELARTGTVTSSVTLDALTQWIWVPPVGLLGIYLILLFPDGRLPSRRWRPFAWFAGAVMVLVPVVFALVPGPLEGHPGVRNPIGLEAYPWLQIVAVFVVVLLPICILASAASLVLRYRRSGEETREQIKWLAFAASFLGVVYFGGLISQLLFAPDALTTNETPLWVSLWQKITFLSYAGIPVAVGFAILKYRLYDIDIIINRALVYGSLTVMLALVYFGGVTVTQSVFQAFTGQEKLPQLAIVASTLVIAALFNPLRRRIQNVIDRRFYRRKYDAAKTLQRFAARLRDETDLDSLNAELIMVVRETIQPERVSLWLRQDTVSQGRDRADKSVDGQPGAVKGLHRR
jgi:MFS family permease